MSGADAPRERVGADLFREDFDLHVRVRRHAILSAPLAATGSVMPPSATPASSCSVPGVGGVRGGVARLPRRRRRRRGSWARSAPAFRWAAAWRRRARAPEERRRRRGRRLGLFSSRRSTGMPVSGGSASAGGCRGREQREQAEERRERGERQVQEHRHHDPPAEPSERSCRTGRAIGSESPRVGA